MDANTVESEQNGNSKIKAEQSHQASTEQVKKVDNSKSPGTLNTSATDTSIGSSKTVLDKQTEQDNSSTLANDEDKRKLGKINKSLDEANDCGQTDDIDMNSLDDWDLHEGAHQSLEKAKKLQKSRFCTIL